MDEKQKFDEVQSKTLILSETKGVDDMLAKLNEGRDKLDKNKAVKQSEAKGKQETKQEACPCDGLFTTKNIVITVLAVVVIVELILLLLR